jgi:hypothetical protein
VEIISGIVENVLVGVGESKMVMIVSGIVGSGSGSCPLQAEMANIKKAR